MPTVKLQELRVVAKDKVFLFFFFGRSGRVRVNVVNYSYKTKKTAGYLGLTTNDNRKWSGLSCLIANSMFRIKS